MKGKAVLLCALVVALWEISVATWDRRVPKAVVCSRERASDLCPSGNVTEMNYFYDKYRDMCEEGPLCNKSEPFAYERLSDCTRLIEHCPPPFEKHCRHVLKTGTCSNVERQYYYDVVTGKCRKFGKKRCPSQQNQYTSLEECKEICIGRAESTVVSRKKSKKKSKKLTKKGSRD